MRSGNVAEIEAQTPPPSIELGLGSEQRKTVRRCITVLAVLSTGTLIGSFSSLYMLGHYPLLLIAISPIGRHLLLVAPVVDPLAFLAVAVPRRMLYAFTCFQLGRALGPAAIIWLESRAPRAGRWYRWLEQLFAWASRPVVLLLPGPAVSTIAGSSGMGLPWFVPLLGLGLVLRMLLILWLGDWLREPILELLAFIAEYWIPGTLLLIAILAVYRWRRRPHSPFEI